MAAPKEKKYDPIADRSLADWFLVSSGLLVATMVWGIWDEVVARRPWKGHQLEFKEVAAEKYGKDLQEARKIELTPAYQELKRAIDERRKAFQDSPEVAKIDSQIKAAQEEYDRYRGQLQILRGELQEAQYFWEMARGDDREQRRLQLKIESYENGDPRQGRIGTIELARRMMELDVKKKALKLQKLALRKDLDQAQDRLAELIAPRERVQRLLTKVQNDPILIRQTVNDTLGIVDRCESCHVAQRLAGFEKEKGFTHPYTTHPGSFLKHHDVDKIGCTVCHRGQSYAISEPREGHGWDKYWLEPMLMGADAQALCFKCHDTQTHLPEVDRINRGRALVENLGCWGCHKIRGFDVEETQFNDARLDREMVRTQMRDLQAQLAKGPSPVLQSRLSELERELRDAEKSYAEAAREWRQIGPDLTRVKSKVYPGWLERWLAHPKAWRDSTRMPNFRLLEDDNGAEEGGVNEIKAIAAYLWQNSEGPSLERHPLGPPAGVKDLAEEGKALFETVGCVACHGIKKKGENGELALAGGDFAPDLSKIGEKIPYEYLIEWIQDPKKFQPQGRMPDLRLTREEAEKIAAYLTTLKIKDSPNEPEILTRGLEYLEDMALAEQGRKKVQRYGCSSCHNIKGFENAGKVGVELTAVFAKLVHQFDFGLLKRRIKEEYKIQSTHEWYSRAKQIWVKEKLLNPRRWDEGRDLTKKGDDRLKMPDFGLTPEEAEAITCFVQSLDGREVPVAYRYRPEPRKQALIDGEKLIRKYNCVGCHMVDVERVTLNDGSIVTGLPTVDEPDTPLFMQLHADSPALGKKAGETAKIDRTLIAGRTPAFGGDLIPHLIQALIDLEEIDDAVEAAPHLPPLLPHEGFKAQPAWFFQFLKEPYILRPWLRVKMPTFDLSDRETQTLVRYFAAKSGEEYPFEFNAEKHREYISEREKKDPDYLKKAQALFDKLACQSCHVKGKETPKGPKANWAPDLMMTKDRLRPEWLVDWLRDPKKLQPGTKMPQFQWGDQYKDVFPGTAEEQIQAIKDLLMTMGR